MKKQTVQIDRMDGVWTTTIDNRLVSWLFHKLFTVAVDTHPSRGVLNDLGQAFGGRVVKVTGPPEYTPDQPTTGGRVVKVMPRGLKKIKEGQEAEG